MNYSVNCICIADYQLKIKKINCNCNKSETLYQICVLEIYIISKSYHMHCRIFLVYITLYCKFL